MSKELLDRATACVPSVTKAFGTNRDSKKGPGYILGIFDFNVTTHRCLHHLINVSKLVLPLYLHTLRNYINFFRQ